MILGFKFALGGVFRSFYFVPSADLPVGLVGGFLDIVAICSFIAANYGGRDVVFAFHFG